MRLSLHSASPNTCALKKWGLRGKTRIPFGSPLIYHEEYKVYRLFKPSPPSLIEVSFELTV